MDKQKELCLSYHGKNVKSQNRENIKSSRKKEITDTDIAKI